MILSRTSLWLVAVRAMCFFESWLISPNFNQFDEVLNRGSHFFEARPFQRRMGVVLAGGQVWRRQSPLGKLRAVGATADSRQFAIAFQTAESLLGKRHRPRLFDEPIAHISVLLGDLHVDLAAGEFGDDFTGHF